MVFFPLLIEFFYLTFFVFVFVLLLLLLLLLLLVLLLLVVVLILLLLLLLLLSFALSLIIFVNLCIVLYPVIFFFMPRVKDQQSHSLQLILAYFLFVTTIFRLIVCKFYDFVFLL